MGVQLILAGQQHKATISNLLQLYMYDFSEYTKADVEDAGLYAPYPYVEHYWQGDATRFAYLIKYNEAVAGFVFVWFKEEGQHFSIAEFFIVRKYRRMGIGKTIAMQVFALHKGAWQVHQMLSNKPAQLFWRKVIDEYTHGLFSEKVDGARVVQEFESV